MFETLEMAPPDPILGLNEAFRWRGAGLEGFGRPEGFHERQVERWLAQLDGYGLLNSLAGKEQRRALNLFHRMYTPEERTIWTRSLKWHTV